MPGNREGAMRELANEAAAFEIEGFSLARDLRDLMQCYAGNVVEGTLFYGARILEALTTRAVSKLARKPSWSLCRNLEILRDYGLMKCPYDYWAITLRQLGNEVRHVVRHVNKNDMHVGAACTALILEWFFQEFPLGPQLPSLRRDGQALNLSVHPAKLETLMRTLKDGSAATIAADIHASHDSPWLWSPWLPAAVADLLLEEGKKDRAKQVLQKALDAAGSHFRLETLMGLHASRTGDCRRAEKWLEPLYRKRKDDPEVCGIFGGLRRRQGRLQEAYKAYASGWENGKHESFYLGINVASLALRLGRSAEARCAAREVRNLLESRQGAVVTLGNRTFHPGHWHELTLAHTYLLLGEFDLAATAYHEAFQQYAGKTSVADVSRSVAADDLQCLLGTEITFRDFLAAHQPRPENPYIIGVTGHRTLADEGALAAKLVKTIAQSAANAAGRPLVFVSSLAEGADRLFLERAREQFPTAPVWIIMPLERKAYLEDFRTKASRETFQHWLAQADRILYTDRPEDGDRADAYLAAGQQLVDTCHTLIALWDGQPARGKGGTADIVAYAKGKRKHIIRVQAPRYSVDTP